MKNSLKVIQKGTGQEESAKYKYYKDGTKTKV